MRNRTAHGAGAGLIGTAALTAFERIEQRLLGHVPPYALPPMSARLRALRSLEPAEALATARLVRWMYGPAWGALFAWARGGRTSRGIGRVALDGVALAASIWTFEVIALPRLGAVPAIRSWPCRDLVGLAAHTLSFGIATSVAMALGERARGMPGRGASSPCHSATLPLRAVRSGDRAARVP